MKTKIKLNYTYQFNFFKFPKMTKKNPKSY